MRFAPIGPRRQAPLERTRTRAGALAAAALAWSAWAASASAGTGRLVDGKLDLLVYFTYDEPNPSDWEPVFHEYSRLLQNATEGGLQLGTVSFTRCEELKSLADVWVLNDFSGARSHLNGLGKKGLHMTISQTHRSTGGGALGQFGLVHETGHYLWGVYDEYKGYVGSSAQTDPLHYCVTDGSTVGCFMDGGTTVFPNNSRTEFCTRTSDGFPLTSHFQGANNGAGMAVRNDQEYLLGESCWETIEASGVGALLEPTREPQDFQPPHQAVTFDYSRLNGLLGMALVIDRSGSMAAEDKLEQAILGAQVGVGLLRDGEYLAIVAFDDEAEVIFSARSVDAARKAQANAALAALEPGGGTMAGEALLAAVRELERVDGCAEFIVVVSDGLSDDPQPDDPAVLRELLEEDVQVYSIALGSFPDPTALANVAAASAGQFFSASSASELPGVFASIVTMAGAGTPVGESFESRLPPGDVQRLDFDVSGFAGALRASVSFAAGSDVGFELVDPDGARIDFDAPPAGVEAFGSDVQKTIGVPAPLPGAWYAVVTERSGSSAAYDLIAFVDSLELEVSTRAGANPSEYPAPMQVEIAVVAGVPVGGASVRGSVLRPDATRVDVLFTDDGEAVHGDAKADDGVYSTLFARYAGDGAYRFDVDVVNLDGFAASNQECGIFGLGVGEDGQTFGPVPPFRARTEHTVLLTGFPAAPAAPAGTLGAHASLVPATAVVLDGAPPTPVAGFALAVAGDEPVHLAELRLDVEALRGSTRALEALTLRVDADGDGAVDVPSLPLAFGASKSNGTELVFAREGAPLAVLLPGSETRFLLTVGEGLAAGAGIIAPRAPFALPRVPFWPALPGLLLWWLSRLARAPRRTALAGRLAALALGGAAVLSACAGSSSGAGRTGSFEVALPPEGIALESAVTLAPAPVGGAPLAFAFRLE